MNPRLFHDGRVALHAGDCREVLKELPADHFDAACVDPPYHLIATANAFGPGQFEKQKGKKAPSARGFMGKQWDGGQIAHEPETWAAVLRVLKPGAHLVAFHAPKNWHRLALAIEDAGFEIRDNLLWLFGSGFPKSHDVSKAIDRAAGAEREIIGTERNYGRTRLADGKTGYGDYEGEWNITRAATSAAHQWAGWGTALKPAYEPIVLARKPLSESTIAANVLKWGTGAINIDGCRVGTEGATKRSHQAEYGASGWRTGHDIVDLPMGRWPANVTHDGSDEVVSGFPDVHPATSRSGAGWQDEYVGGKTRKTVETTVYPDSGSAARFFYTAKADADDRIGSKHPTVKSLDLMQWLVRLVTPPRGNILDCFAGTGTTAEAALREGFRCTLIEREAEYLADIERRMSLVFEGETGRSVAMAKLKPEGEPLPLFPETANEQDVKEPGRRAYGKFARHWGKPVEAAE